MAQVVARTQAVVQSNMAEPSESNTESPPANEAGSGADSGPKKRRGRWRKLLLGLAAIILVFGGFVTYLFLFPAKPALKAGDSISCQKVAECSRTCSMECPSGVRKLPCMTNCAKRCGGRGCDGARGPYKEMISCVRSECLMKCISGPGPECEQCSQTRCADERAVCFRQVCPESPGADSAPVAVP